MYYNTISGIPVFNRLQIINMTRKIEINNIDDLIRQYNGGVSTKQIAENLGVSIILLTELLKNGV